MLIFWEAVGTCRHSHVTSPCELIKDVWNAWLTGLKYWRWTARSVLWRKRGTNREREGGRDIQGERIKKKERSADKYTMKADETLNLLRCPYMSLFSHYRVACKPFYVYMLVCSRPSVRVCTNTSAHAVFASIHPSVCIRVNIYTYVHTCTHICHMLYN